MLPSSLFKVANLIPFFYHPIHILNVIKPDDQILILLYGISYRQAIFIGLNQKIIPEIPDCSSPSGLFDIKDSEIRIYGLVDFMEQREWIGILPNDQDSFEIVAIARSFASGDTPFPDWKLELRNFCIGVQDRGCVCDSKTGR